MDDLKKLCLESNNLVLIRDLHEAWDEVVSELREKLWQEIDSELKLLQSEIPELRPIPADQIDRDNVSRSYELSKAGSLDIGEDKGCLWFGVYCPQEEHRDSYAMFKRGLKHMSSEDDKCCRYPWWIYVDKNLNLYNPTKEKLKRLSTPKKRKEFAREFVQDVKKLLEALEDIALVNAIKEGEETGRASREQVFKILGDRVLKLEIRV